MDGVTHRFSDDERASDSFVAFCDFSKNVVITLLDEWEVQDDVSFVWTLIVDFGEI